MTQEERNAQIERIILKLRLLGLVSKEENQDTFPGLPVIRQTTAQEEPANYLPA